MNIEATIRVPAIQAYQNFCREIGWSEITGWRARKRKWVQTLNIAGRQYITAEEVERFRQRAANGEFSKQHKTPSRQSDAVVNK